MVIGGFQKFSLIDYPGKMCAIIYARGCNFRCPYCHNPELVLPEKYSQEISLDSVMFFLKRRRGLLDAITISGGEPSIHKDLVDLISKIKHLGYHVKLDTNGSNPEMVQKVIENKLIDYIAMDIKAPLEKYKNVVKQPVQTALIEKSINLILKSKINYEFRTTVDWNLLDENDLFTIAHTIQGANLYYLQKLNQNRKGPFDRQELPVKNKELQRIAENLTIYVNACIIR